VVAAGEGDLRADDGVEAERLGELGELHGAAEVIVVGDGEGGIAEVAGTHDKLFRGRSSSCGNGVQRTA